MGHVFDFDDAKVYENWLKKQDSGFENRIMLSMLNPMPGKTVIDIGCGSGASLQPFIDANLWVTGLDASSHMIDIAKNKIGHRADLYCDIAEDLPFDDNSFDYACFMKSLEYVENPKKALEEACRVTRNRIFIGIWNRHSFKVTKIRINRLFFKTFFDQAYFFSIWEVKQIIRNLSANFTVTWRSSGTIAKIAEHYDLIGKYPFGAFIGIVVTLIPSYRTTPLDLPCEAEPADGTVAGVATCNQRKK